MGYPVPMMTMPMHMPMPMPMHMHPYGPPIPAPPPPPSATFDEELSFGNRFMDEVQQLLDANEVLLDALLKGDLSKSEWVSLRVVEAVTEAARDGGDEAADFLWWLLETLGAGIPVLFTKRCASKLMVELVRACNVDQQLNLVEQLDLCLHLVATDHIACNVLRAATRHMHDATLDALLRVCTSDHDISFYNDSRTVELLRFLAQAKDQRCTEAGERGGTLLAVLQTRMVPAIEACLPRLASMQHAHKLLTDALLVEEGGAELAKRIAFAVAHDRLMPTLCMDTSGASVLCAVVARLKSADDDSAVDALSESMCDTVDVLRIANHSVGSGVVRSFLGTGKRHEFVADKLFHDCVPRPTSSFLSALINPVGARVLLTALELDPRANVVAERLSIIAPLLGAMHQNNPAYAGWTAVLASASD